MGIIQAYRRIPAAAAFLVTALVSWLVAIGAGILCGIAFVYLYDRGQSKGTDFAVFLIGVHALGTFAFVMTFSWLWKFYGMLFRRLPELLLALCLIGNAVDTYTFWHSEYSDFVVVGWIFILFFGFIAVILSKRMAKKFWVR